MASPKYTEKSSSFYSVNIENYSENDDSDPCTNGKSLNGNANYYYNNHIKREGDKQSEKNPILQALPVGGA